VKLPREYALFVSEKDLPGYLQCNAGTLALNQPLWNLIKPTGLTNKYYVNKL